MPPNSTRAARICYVLISNLGLFYGIRYLGWHFFPILYLFWWEELISTIFAVMKLRKLRPFLPASGTQIDVLAREGMVMVRFFFLFVWLIFVLALGMFVMAPKESFLVNFQTLFFKNQLFNLNLLYFFGLQLMGYLPRFLAKNSPSASPEEVAEIGQVMDRRGIIIHVGIIAGAFVGMFWDKSWFVWGFLFVKVVADLVGVFFQKTTFPKTGTQP